MHFSFNLYRFYCYLFTFFIWFLFIKFLCGGIFFDFTTFLIYFVVSVISGESIYSDLE